MFFLHVDAHTKAKNVRMDFKRILSKNILNITMRIEERTIGNIQYPRTHRHCRIFACPPRRLQLIATTNDPPHIRRNTVANRLSLSAVLKLNTLRKRKKEC